MAEYCKSMRSTIERTKMEMPSVFKSVGFLVAFIATIAAIAAITFGIRWAVAGPNGKLAAREQINSGSYRIAAYDHFFNLCAAIQTLESSIDAQTEELKTATGDDVGRVNANIAALKSARAGAIFDYNADAQKSYTLGQFRSSHLPYRLSTESYKEVPTSCTA